MAHILLMILMAVSSIISAITCLIAWRQMCCIGNPEPFSYNHIVSVAIWATLTVLLNIMLSISIFCSGHLFYWTYLLEAFVWVFGMHIYRVRTLNLVDGIMAHTKWASALWFMTTITTHWIVLLNIVAVLCCFSLALFWPSSIDMQYISTFWMIWSVSLIMLCLFIVATTRPNKSLISGLGLYSTIIALSITATMHILLGANWYTEVSDDIHVLHRDFVHCIHSLTLIVLAMVITVLNTVGNQEGGYCFIEEESVWHSWSHYIGSIQVTVSPQLAQMQRPLTITTHTAYNEFSMDDAPTVTCDRVNHIYSICTANRLKKQNRSSTNEPNTNTSHSEAHIPRCWTATL